MIKEKFYQSNNYLYKEKGGQPKRAKPPLAEERRSLLEVILSILVPERGVVLLANRRPTSNWPEIANDASDFGNDRLSAFRTSVILTDV